MSRGVVLFLRALVAVAAGAVAAHAQAPPVVLRMASVAPDSSAYSRELRALALEIERRTAGAVRLKWYFGAIIGDEPEVTERIRKGQLDGASSVEYMCEHLSPSMRVLLMPGAFRDREEVVEVARRLEPLFAAEMKRAGFTLLGTTGAGPVVIFSRQPVRTMAQLRARRLWEWDANITSALVAESMGIKLVRLPIRDASRAYDDGRIDGFVALAAGGLVYQWGVQARYLTDLRMRYMTACHVIADRALARLTPPQREAVRSAFADAKQHFEDVCRDQDELLLGGLFARQGLQTVPVDPAFRAEFEVAAVAGRKRLGELGLSATLIDRVLAIIAELRARSSRALAH